LKTIPKKIQKKNPQLSSSFPQRTFPKTWLIGLVSLLIILRLPAVGHLLSWDEAWILCAIREFLTTGASGQLFSKQFEIHPPAYLGLGMLLSPLEPGFEVRMQILSLLTNSLAFVTLILLVSRLFGRKQAFATGLIYALLPGTMFFDTWIKRDGLMTLFCLLALLIFFKKKDFLAGILFGLCFLIKETAIFFSFGFFVLILLHRPPNSVRRALFLFWGPVIAVSSWWYLFFSRGADKYLSFFQGTSRAATGFTEHPWWYYFAKLKLDLGMIGLLLLGIGIIAIMQPFYGKWHKCLQVRSYKKIRFLPIFMLLPGYAILTVSQVKGSWLNISFFPFLVLLAAFGWQFITHKTTKFFTRAKNRSIMQGSIISAILLALLLGINSLPFNYMGHMLKLSPVIAGSVVSSHEMADAVNNTVREDEKLLILPMLYRTAPLIADPIFYWNLKSIRTLFNNKLDLTYSEFKDVIKKYRINWVLMFPIKRSKQGDLFQKTVLEINPPGYSLTAGYLVKVDKFWLPKDENETSR
jgi:4-amino-4-deoxy-L-arabinose transferase-like glycosyltransferase